MHLTVNHSINSIDPDSGDHKKNIEGSRFHLKDEIKIIRYLKINLDNYVT